MNYRLLTDELIDEIAASDSERWIILDPHRNYPGYWKVQSLDPNYIFDYGELIGPHCVVSPADLPTLFEISEAKSDKVAFGRDPLQILEAYEKLDEPPSVTLNSHFENTVNGFLPYQVQGFNYLKDVEGAAALWTTGPQPLGSPILTPLGWTTMGAVQVGDEVIGSDGHPCRVTRVSNQGEREEYRLTFKDGSTARSTRDHLWGIYDHVGNFYVRSLDSLLERGLTHTRRGYRWLVDRVRPVHYPEVRLPVD